MSIRFLTAGESHGKALLGILDGIPSGLTIIESEIQKELIRRKQGYGRGARQKIESDKVEFLTGIRHGKSMGSPIGFMIQNQDWSAWQEIMQAEPFKGNVRRVLEVPRPGHADYIGGLKYNHQDMRNVLERASARETAMRVALGSVARIFLQELGIYIGSRVIQIGSAKDESECKLNAKNINQKSDRSEVRCLNAKAEKQMIRVIESAKKTGNTCGGVFEVMVEGAPLGLGSYTQWDRRLEGDLSKAIVSLNAIKGVEIGLGFGLAKTLGTEAHDEFFPAKKKGRIAYKTNRSGGIDGGMTTGQTIVVRAVMKPISTLMKPLRSVKLKTGKAEKAHIERSDTCAVPAAAVIAESCVALVIANAVLEKFGGDSMPEIKERVKRWNEKTK